MKLRFLEILVSFPILLLVFSLPIKNLSNLEIETETGTGTGTISLNLKKHYIPPISNSGSLVPRTEESAYNLPKEKIFNKAYFYSVNIGIGVPSVNYSLFVDTGSSDLWVTNDTSITDLPYDNNADSSKILTNEYDTYTYIQGFVKVEYATNTFDFAGKSFRNVPYGIAYETQDIGILREGTTGYLGLSYPSRSKRNNLAELLKEGGYINRNSYSLYFTPNRTGDGEILFGGVDHSKYTGDLYKVSRVNIPEFTTTKTLSANLTSIFIGESDFEVNRVALFDTGSTFTFLPPDIYNEVSKYYGIQEDVTTESGEPLFNTEVYGDKEIEFNFSGARFKISGKQFALDFRPGIQNSFDDVFGILSTTNSRNITIIGSNILKAAYIVFDLDGEEIGLGQSKLDTSDCIPDIEPIIDSIPGAKIPISSFPSSSLDNEADPKRIHRNKLTSILYFLQLFILEFFT